MVDEPASAKNPFADFFQDPLYLEFKNHLYNYRLRRQAVRKELDTLRRPELILEIGSGVSTMTEPGKGIIYSDISPEALQHLTAHKAIHHGLVMSVTHIAFRDESIPVIICSEVLEHVKDDEAALDEMYRVLEPGGSLILTVPVHPQYFAYDDHYVKHERRYAVLSFLRKLHRIGFDDVHLVKVTGVLDKIAMILLAGAYSLFVDSKTDKPRARASALLKILLPVYKFLNWIYAGMVHLEAQIMPLYTSAVVLIHCVKAEGVKTVLRQESAKAGGKPEAV